jgi:hypothetical protein
LLLGSLVTPQAYDGAAGGQAKTGTTHENGTLLMAKDKKQNKILRVGIVQGGRIIEERLLRHKEAITIGQAPKNKFMIPSPRVPIAYTLIDVKGGKYILCFEKGMLGKILVGDEIVDLKTIAKRRLAQRKDAKFRFTLSEESRGKIVLGDVTLLFQFVTPPPEVAKLQLPAEAKGAWWRNIDKALMTTFMCSLIVLGGSGGYSDFWWRYTGRYLAPTKKAKSAIFQTLVNVTKAQKEVKKDPTAGDKQEDPDKIQDSNADPDKKAEEALDEPIADSETPVEAVDDDSATGVVDDEELVDAVNTEELTKHIEDEFRPAEVASAPKTPGDHAKAVESMVATKTIAGVLGSDFGVGGSAGHSNILDNGFASNANGSGFGKGTLGTEGGPGSIYANAEDGGIGDSLGTGEVAGLTGTRPVVAETDLSDFKVKDVIVEGNVKTGRIGTKLEEHASDTRDKPKEKTYTIKIAKGGGAGQPADKASVNKYMRARSSALERCYIRVARKNPDLKGKLTVLLKIDMSGRARPKIIKDQTGDPSLGRCIIDKIKGWQFPKPVGRPVSMKFPFVFRAR